MPNVLKTIMHRLRAERLPMMEEIERFGADGEEAVYRLLCESFDCVLRNIAVPHKSLYLEKDFLVVENGVPFVLEVKHWKGEIGCREGTFYQNKENGVHKTLKSPVGTTNQFIERMKAFYDLERPVWGMVVFAGKDCKLDLPEEMDGIALLPVSRMVSFIRKKAKEERKIGSFAPIDPSRLLRCTRLYDVDREFCKGILADTEIACIAENGARVCLDTTRLYCIAVEHQPLRLRDKLYVVFDNGESGVFFASDAEIDLHCLDGSWRRFSLNRLRYIMF